jgi:AcrR family transcriptional regulator
MLGVVAEPLSNRPAGKRETREALIQAGIAELAAKGLQEPSLDVICARAGYTRGAFYVHFEDREDFVAAVMERVMGGFLDAILETGHGELGLAPPGAGRAIQLHRLIEACARSPRIRERWVALVREATLRLANAVGDAQAADGLRSDVEAEQIGALLVGLALGAVAARESGVPFEPVRAREAVFALLSAPRAQRAS